MAQQAIEMKQGQEQGQPDVKPEGGKLSGITDSYRSWRKYQKELPEMIAAAEKNLLWLESALTDYRMTLLELSYKQDTVDAEIWDLFTDVRDEVPRLKRETLKTPLYLRNNTHLDALRASWKALLVQEERLLDLISQAPDALRYYNTAQLLRVHLAEEHARRSENVQMLSQAREQLERTLVELDHHTSDFEPISLGSKILRLDDAQKVWNVKLEEFRGYEQSGEVIPDDLLLRIQQLNDTVREAPTSARWIRATEVKFQRLAESNDLLLTLGKPAVPKTEMARASTLLFDIVPRLWMSGNNEELGRNLQYLEKFIAYQEDVVKRELEFAEKRRPGITQALSMSALNTSFNLEQIVILARSLVHAVDSRDRFMRGHSEEVTRLALQTARGMNWSASDLEYLELAGLLHDVGKLAIPEAVLSKVQPLTPDERTLIQKHPFYGANIVKPVAGLNRIVPWIYHHQERWDGEGYPDHLSRKDIPMGANIIAVAEAYTVMTMDMPYHQALSKDAALKAVQQESGRQFHPEVVEAFIEGQVDSPIPVEIPKMEKSPTGGLD
jgi:putative nucleotidyltransferase with HDIG domain